MLDIRFIKENLEAVRQNIRDRYMNGIRTAAHPFLFPKQRAELTIVPATLGELALALGAALAAL